MKKAIQQQLYNALIGEANMSYALYKHEVEEHLADWKAGMRRDKDEFLVVVTAHSGDVAMLLLTAKSELFINELAREKLRAIWHPKKVYESNITQLLPTMAAQLADDILFVTGVKTMR